MGPGIDLPGKLVPSRGLPGGAPSMGPGIDLPGKGLRLALWNCWRTSLQWGPGLISRESFQLTSLLVRDGAPSMGPGIDLPGKEPDPRPSERDGDPPSMGPGIDLPGKRPGSSWHSTWTPSTFNGARD